MKSSPMYEAAIQKYYGMQGLLIDPHPASDSELPKTLVTPSAMRKINVPRLSSMTQKLQSDSRNNSPTLSVISVHSDSESSEPESTGTTFAFWAVFWTEVFLFFPL